MGRILSLKLSSRVKDGVKYFVVWVPGRLSAKGQPQERLFRRRADAERFKLELLAAWRETDGVPLSANEISDAREAWRLLSENGIKGISLAEVVRRALPMLLRGGQMTVAELAAEYVAVRSPGWRAKTASGFRHAERKFSAVFGERALAGLESVELAEWLAGAAGSVATRANLRRTIEPMFSYAVRQGIIPSSPWERVEKERAEERSVEIDVLTVGEAARLMEVAPTDCKAAFALMLFAGVRPREVERLRWADIRDGVIHISGAIAKTRQARNVDISENLAAWLQVSRNEYREMVCPANWKRKNQDARRAAGIAGRADVCRHSFASYHLAAHGDIDALKLQMGHSYGSNVLFVHYRAAVTRAAAAEFWKITPKRMGTGATMETMNRAAALG